MWQKSKLESGASAAWIFFLIVCGIIAVMLPYVLVNESAMTFIQIGLDNGGNSEMFDLIEWYWTFGLIFASVIAIALWAIVEAQIGG